MPFLRHDDMFLSNWPLQEQYRRFRLYMNFDMIKSLQVEKECLAHGVSRFQPGNKEKEFNNSTPGRPRQNAAILDWSGIICFVLNENARRFCATNKASLSFGGYRRQFPL